MYLGKWFQNKNNLSKSPSGVGECGETEEKSVNRVSMVSSAADSLSQSPSHTSNPKRPVTLQVFHFLIYVDRCLKFKTYFNKLTLKFLFPFLS